MAGFHTCGPNEAMVVSGMCHGQPEYIPGGRVFVWPFVQQIEKISLNTITLEVMSPKVYTKVGVPISVTGIAQVKVEGRNKEMLSTACTLFLGKTERDIQNVALETLEGHQRAIMGLMTVEEIYQDRKKFSDKVFEVASSDMVNMGITVVSYTLKDIRDEEDYLHSLGMRRTAQVKRDARMGEAEALRDATMKAAKAKETEMIAKYSNDTDIAKSKRDYELNRAAYDEEINAKKAVAELAYKLQAAKKQQQIKEQEMEIKVVERAQQIELQKEEVERRQRELAATVHRPAEAEKYKLEKVAEAERIRVTLEAQAKAEAEQLKGEAEADAILAQAKAEAEMMSKKAAAWSEYKEAAMVEMALDALPKIAAEVANPLVAGLKEVKMVSTGNGEIGAAKLTGEVMDIMVRVPQMVHEMTGVDLQKAMKTQS